MTIGLPPPLQYVTHSQQNSPAKRRHLEAYARQAQRMALEEAKQACETVHQERTDLIARAAAAMCVGAINLLANELEAKP